MPRVSRLLVAAVAVLVGLDLTGGLIAIATDLNDVGEAWILRRGLPFRGRSSSSSSR